MNIMAFVCFVVGSPSDILQDQPQLDPSTSSAWDWSEIPGLDLNDARKLEQKNSETTQRLETEIAVAGGSDLHDVQGFLRTQVDTPHMHMALVLGREPQARMVWDLSRGAVLVRDETPAWVLLKWSISGSWGKFRWLLGSFTARTQGGLVFSSPRRYGDDEALLPDAQTRVVPRTGDLYVRDPQWGVGVAWEPVQGMHGALFASVSPVAMSQYAWMGGVDPWSSQDGLRPAFLNAKQPTQSVAWQTSGSGMIEALVGSEVGWRDPRGIWLNASGYVAKRIVRDSLQLRPSENAGMPTRDVYGAWGFGAGFDQNAWHARSAVALTDRMAPALLIEGRYDVSAWEWGGHVRYYGRNYDNPHTVAPASPNQSFGFRTRNEMGVRSWIELRRALQTRLVADVSMPPMRVPGDIEPLRWRVDLRTGRFREGNGVRAELYTGGQMMTASPALQHGVALRSDARMGRFQGSMRAFMIWDQVLGKVPMWPYGASLAMVMRVMEWFSVRVLADVRHESNGNRLRCLAEMVVRGVMLEGRFLAAVAHAASSGEFSWNVMMHASAQF